MAQKLNPEDPENTEENPIKDRSKGFVVAKT